MKATALDCALGWLEVASMAIQRAAACAALGMGEADERYVAARTRLEERARHDRHELRVARAIHLRLARERRMDPPHLGVAEDAA